MITTSCTFVTSDYMTHLEYFIFILAMTELKSNFDILSMLWWENKKVGYKMYKSAWDFSASYILPLRKFGKLNENTIFKVHIRPVITNPGKPNPLL